MTQQSNQVPVTIHVVARGEPHRLRPGSLCEMAAESRKERGRFPGKRCKRLPVELRSGEADQVRSLLVGRRAQDRRVPIQPIRDDLPVHLVQGRTVAAHGNDTVVPRRERAGKGVGKPRPKRIAPLPGVGDLQHRKVALGRGLSRVLVEGFGDLPIFGVVPPYELLVLPLPLGAVAEEQNGGTVVRHPESNPSLTEDPAAAGKHAHSALPPVHR